jgi:hypothetical protein
MAKEVYHFANEDGRKKKKHKGKGYRVSYVYKVLVNGSYNDRSICITLGPRSVRGWQR